MRACPTCETQYPDGVEVCARDGVTLVPVPNRGVTPAELGSARTVPDLSTGTPAERGSASPPPATAPASGSSQVAAPKDAAPGLAAAALATAAIATPGIAAASGEAFDSLVGATLAGRYQIVRRIGEGGMGAVYEAKHTIIGKRVAVKVLLEKFLTKSDFVARLLQEARLASAIGHEHIVDVTDFGTTDDGRAFVAMEFLDGESLAQLVMREAPLPVERSLRITRQVASALGAAHAKGIVHRDVKPENVYLIRRGDADFVKVVDFGISKAVKQGQGDDTPDYHLTHTGLLLGTPLYMSPEQARGDEDLDHRVDVWAMGVMLYECLTGEVPFRANNYLGIISQVLTHTALPPSKLRPELGIPEAVEAVVMHAMEKDRSRRYAHMAEVEQDLERLLAGDQNVGAGAGARPATVPPPAGVARGRAWVWSAAVAALVAGVAMVLARPDGPSAEIPQPTAAPSAGAARVPVPTPLPAKAERPVISAPAPAPAPAERPIVPEPRPGTPAGTPPAAVVDRMSTEAGKTAGVAPARRPVRSGVRPTSPRDKIERSGHAEAAASRPADKAKHRSSDPVLRGAVESRSREGYPDN